MMCATARLNHIYGSGFEMTRGPQFKTSCLARSLKTEMGAVNTFPVLKIDVLQATDGREVRVQGAKFSMKAGQKTVLFFYGLCVLLCR